MAPGNCFCCETWSPMVHRFPTNFERALAWARAMNWENGFKKLIDQKKPTETIFICSNHFDISSYENGVRENGLKWGSMPETVKIDAPAAEHKYNASNGIVPPFLIDPLPEGKGKPTGQENTSEGADIESPPAKKKVTCPPQPHIGNSQKSDSTWGCGLSQETVSEPMFEKETPQERAFRRTMETESMAKTGSRYALLSHSSLLDLLDMIPGCMQCYNVHAKRTFSMVGAVLKMDTNCPSCKKWTWNSTKKVHEDKMGSVLEGNLDLSASMFLAGISYERMHDACTTMGLGITRRNTHFELIKNHMRPVIDEAFVQDSEDVIQRVERKFAKNANMKTPLSLIGDAQFDSRGFSASVCRYTMMEYQTRYIVAIEIMMKRNNEGNSPVMESRACGVIMERLNQDARIEIIQLTTDKNTAVISLLRKKFPLIAHKLDKWHIIKNFKKINYHEIKLVRNLNLRVHWELLLVHLWVSIDSANGDSELAKELIRSSEYHLQGIHVLPKDEFKKITRCAHSTTKDFSQSAQLDPIVHKKQIQVLHGMVNDPTFLENVGNCASRETTSPLEAFHSVVAQIYLQKNDYFDEETSKTLMKLATIHHNNHRKQLIDAEDSGQTFPTRKKYSKAQDRVREIVVHPKPNLTWKQDILQSIKDHYKDKKEKMITNRTLGRPTKVVDSGEEGDDGAEEDDDVALDDIEVDEEEEYPETSDATEGNEEDLETDTNLHEEQGGEQNAECTQDYSMITKPFVPAVPKPKLYTTPLQFPKVYLAMGSDADKYINKLNGLLLLPI